MDSEQRETVLRKLYDDRTLATLKRPKDIFEHILTIHFHVNPSSGNENEIRTSPLNELLNETTRRLKEWSEEHNRKSYKLAKKLRDSARRLLELIDKIGLGSATAGNEIAAEERREYLESSERYYTKAIISVPYACTENIEHGSDKVARLKASLFQERAEVRFRSGKYERAIADVACALHHADTVGEQFAGYRDLKLIAVKCFAELKLLESDAVNDVIDYVTADLPSRRQSDSTASDGDDVETVEWSDQKNQQQVADTLNDMIAYNGHVSNFGIENAPQLSNDGKGREEAYFRYQLDDKFELCESSTRGRHFIAKQNIPTGSMLLVEKPYSAVVHRKYLDKRCNLCLKELDDEGYPCDFCKEARFCCVACLEEAYHTYHQYECGILGFLLSTDQLSTVHVYRIISQIGLLKALKYERTRHLQSFTINDYMAKSDLRNKNGFDQNDDDRFVSYKMSSSLMEHSDRYTSEMNAFHAMQALNLALVLLTKNRSLVPNDQSLREIFLELLILCFVQIRRIGVNVFGQFDYDAKGTRHTVATIEILIGSLINHSCEPNLQWQINSGHLMFKTTRAVSANEELTITYGQTRANPFQQRQNALQHYHFLCNCSLCRAEIVKMSDVAQCEQCKNGPIVIAKTNAGCLDCGVSTTPERVLQTVKEIRKHRQLLEWYHRMVFTFPTSVNNGIESQQGFDFEQNICTVVAQIEACVRRQAYRGTNAFTEALRRLAEIYLHFERYEQAFELCQLYEESVSKQPDVRSVEDNRSAVENKLIELNFWTDLCQKYFARVVVTQATASIDIDCYLHIAILLHVRFLKLVATYIADSIGPDRMRTITITELLERVHFSDAKLAYILCEKKKVALTFILKYAKGKTEK